MIQYNTFWTVAMIFGWRKKVANRTYRRDGKGRKKTKLGCRVNGTKLVKRCIKFNAIKELAHLLLGSGPLLNNLRLEVPSTNKTDQNACSCMPEFMTLNEDVTNIIRDPAS